MLCPDKDFCRRVWYVLGALALGGFVVAAIVLTSTYLIVAAVGVLVAVLAARLIAAIQRRFSVRRPVAYGIAWTLLIVTPIALLAFSVQSLVSQFSNLSGTLRSLYGQISMVAGKVPGGELFLEQVLRPDGQILFGQLSSAAASFTATVTGLLVMFFVALFVSYHPRYYLNYFLLVLPPLHRQRAVEHAHLMAHVLVWWSVARLTSMLAVTVLTYLGLMLLGVELAFLLAVLAGVLSIIPNFGTLAALALAVLVTLPESTFLAASVFVMFVMVQTIEGYLITPLVELRTVETPPAFMLVLEVLLAILFGIVGLLVAGPLAAIITMYAKRRGLVALDPTSLS